MGIVNQGPLYVRSKLRLSGFEQLEPRLAISELTDSDLDIAYEDTVPYGNAVFRTSCAQPFKCEILFLYTSHFSNLWKNSNSWKINCKQMKKEVDLKYVNITTECVMLFTNVCRQCQEKSTKKRKELVFKWSELSKASWFDRYADSSCGRLQVDP